jgi:hypothetical protein
MRSGETEDEARGPAFAWPSTEEVSASPELWFRLTAGQPGAGVFVGDDSTGARRWASEAARLRYDLALRGPAARRCPIDLTAFDARRPRGQLAKYCSAACRNRAAREAWREGARWMRCPVDGVGHLVAAAGTSRPRPACPPLPDALGRLLGPSECERAYAKVLARRRMARHRAARRAERELERAVDGLIADLADWR